jgi:hypothetical protein
MMLGVEAVVTVKVVDRVKVVEQRRCVWYMPRSRADTLLENLQSVDTSAQILQFSPSLKRFFDDLFLLFLKETVYIVESLLLPCALSKKMLIRKTNGGKM